MDGVGGDIEAANAVWSHAHTAFLLRQKGDVDGAVAAYERAVASPAGPVALGDTKSSSSEWARCHADACFNLANILREIGDGTRAATMYRDAIDAKPDHTRALSNLGGLLLNQASNPNSPLDGNADAAEAAELFRTALASMAAADDVGGARINTDEDSLGDVRAIARVNCNLAIALLRLADVDGAEASAREALRIDSTCVHCANHRFHLNRCLNSSLLTVCIGARMPRLCST
jgi:tetratricopeptide (TPR) repeat protein